ncbi:MAG: hemolysin family protein [Microvirgula sp.]
MSFLQQLLLIAALIAVSMFFSISEISLAAARKIRLRQWADEGMVNAQRVLDLQAKPGHFFTVVQIGVNAVAILGGIVGEPAFTPYYARFVSLFYQGPEVAAIGFVLSFLTVTSLFILIADLLPKRLGLLFPELIAVRIVGPMLTCVKVCMPLVWLFNGLANLIFRLLKVPMARSDDITSDDIIAVMAAGAEAGVLHAGEHQLIENVFELESRTVSSSMTARESIVWLPLLADNDLIRRTIAANPHSKFLVCDDAIDNVVGYVDTKDLLVRALNGQSISLKTEPTVRQALLIPDTLTLSEILSRFKSAREDFAVILNEYALVVGIITLNDVMSTVMGDLVSVEEEQIVQRDELSWLVDGVTPIDDVMRVLDIDAFPDDEHYETVAGFMMYMLRKIPKRTDCVSFAGYKFEVVDIDNYKIDQLLVTRLPKAQDGDV